MKAILSDQHLHNWTQFATIDDDGVNSRLKIILDEMKRASRILKDAGGSRMFFAGDLFHVRGRIEPSVFNPSFDVIKEICKSGIEIFAIPGNHDLENKDTDEIGSAIAKLGEISGFHVIHETECIDDVVMIPWYQNLEELKEEIFRHASPDRDLIIHAPVNKVLIGIPDHGLDGEWLQEAGYRRVFAGHFHNHCEVAPGVFSVGATTHQTFSDVGTKAGFILFDYNEVRHIESEAPKFMNLDDIEDLPEVKGNYVRIRLTDVEPNEVNEIRDKLFELGAVGVVNHSIILKKVLSGHFDTETVVRQTMRETVKSYIEKELSDRPYTEKLEAFCDEIITHAQAVMRE